MGMREFGQLVRERREALGLSAMDVAYSVGQAQSWLSKLENGGATHPPEPSIMLALADVLKLPESEMFRAMGYRFGVAEDRPAYDADVDTLAREIAALPAPPDAGAIRAAASQLATVADLLAVMQPPELRALLAELGTVVVSDAGVCVRYRPPFDALLAGGVVPVPRWGRGLR